MSPIDTILESDCLARLPELAASGARFDLIYVDPPFNAGGKRRARLATGVERAHGTLAYNDHFGNVDAFIEMLEPRLAAMRACLSPTGSLWLHLSHHTVHEAKAAADRVFGRGGFQGEVIWIPGNGGRRRNGPSITHQTILIYARSASMIWNADDSALREPYADTSLRMHFKEVDADGRRFRERVIAGKAYRYYADEGRRLGSVWADCPAMNANTPLTNETTGYPTQKPEALLERIIRAASLPSSHVLDPMCGSGTTLAVAVRLGRRALGIDQSPVACDIARTRLNAALASASSGAGPRRAGGARRAGGEI
ncbi:MAG TPA: site-specific DNA-methyltransferase [Polyangiaceae bacterium]|nr:site-specific DNA-methyltransferase [Polyangiaceae bacterium]